MTRDDIIVMFQMRVNGKTLEEIGKEFGVTRERVRQLLDAHARGISRGHNRCKTVFPGLRDWMFDNCCSGYKMRHETNLGITLPSFYSKMQGERPFKIDEIRKILAYTGLTFEEAFGTVEANACEQ